MNFKRIAFPAPRKGRSAADSRCLYSDRSVVVATTFANCFANCRALLVSRAQISISRTRTSKEKASRRIRSREFALLVD